MDAASFSVENGTVENYGTEMNNSLLSSTFQPSANMVDSGIDADIEFNREMYNLLMDTNPQPIYSRKVFLGSLPSYVTTGYMFATFASAESVVKLVNNCTYVNSRLTISIPLSNKLSVSIHVRVWCTKDVKYCSPECDESFMRNLRNCVFVGGIPRTMTAKQLSYFMSITFGDIVFAKIEVELETDYPKGAACVMFRDREAFVAAVAKRFVPLNFGGHIELQPYLMRMVECDICRAVKTRNFCPQLRCLKFMCDMCWKQAHADMPDHQPQERSPPLRARQLAQASSDDRRYKVVNSIQFPPISLFDIDSDSHSDWNTDCGIFDSRGPPPHAFRNRPTSDTNHQSGVAQQTRGRFGFSLEKNGNSTNHRSRWSKGPAQKRSNTRYRCFYPSHANHYTNSNNNDYRRRLLDHSHEGPSSLCCSSYGKGESQWSERITRASSSSNARSLIASNVNQLAKQRISFSPTVRRPVRRQSDGDVHGSTNNVSLSDKNASNNIVDAFAQFKLF
ncbi:hypothetical protein OESDEN_10598 [Oesophagostomum dentatum]|uniref:RRM domain-containing protein n=1 Tax=Oesophagostomum dentatum TaxID=61180 RepID=A0A0B1SWA1_OESDE|nr:hypothetical protein OESDEN_10598 [Oesophagostomum dentatum]